MEGRGEAPELEWLLVRHAEKVALRAECFIARGARVFTVVLAESIWVLASGYDIGLSGQATAIHMMLNHLDLTIHDREMIASELRLFRAKPHPGFSDCLVLEMARKAGHPPSGTFDRHRSRVSGVQRV